MTPLSVSREKDRAAMADRLAGLARKLGASVKVEPMGARELWVRIVGPRGLAVTVDFDGASRQQRHGIWVVSWYIQTSSSDAKLSVAFGDVNRYHFQKSTDVALSFEDLLAVVERGLQKANDGSAFQAAG